MTTEKFGKYTLLSRLGYGGVAEVFLAKAQGPGGFEKSMALKRLLPNWAEDAHVVALLADEARITVRLSHPNIVQIYDFGCVDQSYYIAMEYVDGVDLKTLIANGEGPTGDSNAAPLPIDLSIFIVGAILDALHFAHTCVDDNGQPLGVIHRDVTPHNVLISRKGEIKLTDFGVARARISSHVSMVGDIRGSFCYMPPEQACGGEIDYRVDLFAAGAILYELISGRQAFRASNIGHQMALLNQSIKPPSTYNSDVSPQLDAVVKKALALDPAHRYESARAFAAELRQTRRPSIDDQDPIQLAKRLGLYVNTHLPNPQLVATPVDDHQITALNVVRSEESTAIVLPATVPEVEPAYQVVVDASANQFANTETYDLRKIAPNLQTLPQADAVPKLTIAPTATQSVFRRRLKVLLPILAVVGVGLGLWIATYFRRETPTQPLAQPAITIVTRQAIVDAAISQIVDVGIADQAPEKMTFPATTVRIPDNTTQPALGLLIVTAPIGSRVFIDGRLVEDKMSSAPIKRSLKPGKHQVKVIHGAGRRRSVYQQYVTIRVKKTAKLDFHKEKKTPQKTSKARRR